MQNDKNINIDQIMRNQVLKFYEALRQNDVDALTSLMERDFPLKWVQSFAETSLPEYAMRHGSVESAWWLMAQGQMPESWSSFTGSAWKSFLKKGFQMTISGNGPDIPLDVYKEIVKVALKVSGEKLPMWLDGLRVSGTSKATSFLGQLGKSISQSVDKKLKEAKQSIELRNKEKELQENENENEKAEGDKPFVSTYVKANKATMSKDDFTDEIKVPKSSGSQEVLLKVSKQAKVSKTTKNTKDSKAKKTVAKKSPKKKI